MRVLVQQQFHPGHFYQYAAYLLPAVLECTNDVVVAVTPQGFRSTEFESYLAPFSGKVRFDTSLPDADPALPLAERLKVHRVLRRTVRAVAPDYVLIPSGDAESTFMSAYRIAGAGSVPSRVPCELGIHYGSGRPRDWLTTLNFLASGATRVHLVNHLYYEQVRRHRAARKVFRSLPSPVARHNLGKIEGRRRLGLPEDGTYIGLAASFDYRKAVAEFLAAFRSA